MQQFTQFQFWNEQKFSWNQKCDTNKLDKTVLISWVLKILCHVYVKWQNKLFSWFEVWKNCIWFHEFFRIFCQMTKQTFFVKSKCGKTVFDFTSFYEFSVKCQNNSLFLQDFLNFVLPFEASRKSSVTNFQLNRSLGNGWKDEFLIINSGSSAAMAIFIF